jgi:hypothetical protein
MEPILVVCGGCGVKIRTTHPEKARNRDCPRCATPLARAFDVALGPRVGPTVEARTETHSGAGSLKRTLTALALIAAIVLLALFVIRDGSLSSTGSASRGKVKLTRIELETLMTGVASTIAIPAADLNGPEKETHAELTDALTPPPSPRNLAILEDSRRDPIFTPGPPTGVQPNAGPLDRRTPPAPVPSVSADAATTPRRLRVRDSRGRSIVAREYGSLKGRPAALLPDGQIGWPEGLVVTDEPFLPASMDEMEQTLRAEPEFAGFGLIKTAHYLVAFEGTEPFARASADLLEKLHDGLTEMLKRNSLPLDPMEFPLVAVIFSTEDRFRANRRIAADVQAYYEILSNRIYFYERSRRDQDAPEVSALRKPQTVAHEGTHQILHNVGIQSRLSDWPLWLVEGLAEYCSSTRFTKKGADWAGIGQVNPIHLATIRDLDDPVPNQFRGDHREAVVLRERGTPLVEYLVTRKELSPTDYALSWALTHYLATQRLDDLMGYIRKMSQLRPFEDQSPSDQLAAFRESFGNELAQLDGKVGKHLKKFKPTDSLPHYAVIFEQPVGPRVVRRSYMVSQSPSVIRQWIDSVTAPEGGVPQWRVIPHMTQKRALEAAEKWIGGSH